MAANRPTPLISPTEVYRRAATLTSSARVAYNNCAPAWSSTTAQPQLYWNTANNAAGKDTAAAVAHCPAMQPGPGRRSGRPSTSRSSSTTASAGSCSRPDPGLPTTVRPGRVVRAEPRGHAAPQPVGGDLKIGTFNVLNYFNTTRWQYSRTARGRPAGSCTSFFDDRAGNPIGNNTCGIVTNSCHGQRPARSGDHASFQRQQAKIVNAINTLDADIVSRGDREQREGRRRTDRDEALSALVDALNADAGAGTWTSSTRRPKRVDAGERRRAGRDPHRLHLQAGRGRARRRAPTCSSARAAFANAREPFAQAFKVAGADDAQGFAVIVNHFKSKGCSRRRRPATTPTDDRTVALNGDRTGRHPLSHVRRRASPTARGVEAVFLDRRLQRLPRRRTRCRSSTTAGYERLDGPTASSPTASTAQSQSLDHVLGNAAAARW